MSWYDFREHMMGGAASRKLRTTKPHEKLDNQLTTNSHIRSITLDTTSILLEKLVKIEERMKTGLRLKQKKRYNVLLP